MAGPYSNPTEPPYSGSLSWEPPTPRSGFGGSVAAFGHNALSIVRGQFRQDLPFVDGTGTLAMSSVGATSASGSEGWPVLAAFRPLQNPSLDRGAPPADPFTAAGPQLQWRGALRTPSRLSAITLLYDLTVDIDDPDLPKYLASPDDQKALAAYLADRANVARPSLDLTKLTFARLTATQGTNDKEFPLHADDQAPLAVAITRFSDDKAKSPTKLTVRFGPDTAVNPSDFALSSAVTVAARYPLKSLKLSLHRAMLFDAARVNVPVKNLPCSYLAYAYGVQFSVTVGGQLDGSLTFPNIGTSPTLYVKLFSPDYRTGSPGFAHGLGLRFLMFGLPDSIGDISGGLGSVWRCVFIGPVPATRSVRYTLSGQAVKAAPGRLAAFDHSAIQSAVSQVALDKTSYAGASAPPAGTDWTRIGLVAVGGPQSLDPAGPIVSPYLQLDGGGGRTAWYRTRQATSSGGEIDSDPFQNTVYSERTVFRMSGATLASSPSDRELIVRRPTLASALPNGDVLQAPPLALFWADDDRLLVTGASVGMGAWTLGIRASVDDAGGLLDTHLVARLWLVPENLSPSSDVDTIQGYRDQFELTFASGASGALKMARATSLADMLVSPALGPNLETLEMARYVESVAGAADGLLRFDFGPNVRGRLVVGLYVAAYLTPDGKSLGYDPLAAAVPRFCVEVDSDYAYVETTLQQTLSDTIDAIRPDRYTSSSYKAVAAPLAASRDLYGGDQLGGAAFVPYSKRVAAYDPTVAVALNGLCLLEQAGGGANVVLPFGEIAQKPGVEEASVKADFVTGLRTAPGGRVRAGRWSASLQIDVDADYDAIDVSFRIEAMLVGTDGMVSYRVFTSPVLERDGTTVSYDADVAIPFLVSVADVQLALRLTAYPRSKNGASITVSDLQKRYPKLAIGARVVSLSLTAHTLDELAIAQTDSLAGSPAFNEDLPIEPNEALGDQGFIFVADDSLLAELVLTGGAELPVSGSVYSPAWKVALPEDMEARIVSSGIGDSTIYVRTVPSQTTGQTTKDARVSAAQSRRDGSLHLAFESSKDPAVSALDDDDNHVRYAVLQQFGQRPRLDVKVMDGTGKSMPGTVPDVAFSRRGEDGHQGDLLALTTQMDGDSTADLALVVSGASGQPFSWSTPSAPYGGDAVASPQKLVRGAELATTRPSPVDQATYTVAWADPGAVVLKVATPLDALPLGVPEGTAYLVDGDAGADLGLGQELVRPLDLNGPVPRTFPGLVVKSDGGAIVFYGLEGRPGQAWARAFDGSAVQGPAVCVASLAGTGIPIGTQQEMKGFCAAWDESVDHGALAFWCDGKIMVAPLEQGPRGFLLRAVQLVAGSADLTDDAGLQAAVAQGRLRTLRIGAAEADVPEQTPALVLGQGFGTSGSAFVFYQDADETVWGREVILGGVTKDAYIVR